MSNNYKYIKERFGSIWSPGIKMWSNGLPLKADTYQSCRNFCRYCLRSGTMIKMTNKTEKPIEEIKVGDKVISININDMSRNESKVDQIYKREVNEIYKLSFWSKTLYITEEHPMYIENKGWVKVKDLKIGDKCRWFMIKKPIKRPDFSEYLRKNNPMKNPEIAKKTYRKSRLTLLKNGYSKGQSLLNKYLEDMGINFEKEYAIYNKGSYKKQHYFLDVAILDQKICIEYDGHQRHLKEKDKDIKRDKYLKSLGWKTLRIKRNEIFNEEFARNKIETFLKEVCHNPFYFYAIIRNIELIKEKTTVYNFGCTPNNNYLAEGYLVHNCYANELRSATLGRIGIKQNLGVARIINLRQLATFFERAYNFEDEKTPFMNWAARQKYFIELGTTGETFQEADLDLRVTYNFIKLMSEYQMPLFINTKLNLICHNDEYRNLLINYKAPIIICLTLTTVDDKLGKIYEPLSPLPSERLKTIKELSQYEHIKNIVYISPFIPSVTDLDIETYIHKIMDANIISGHLRDFYMQGKIFQNSFWKKYIEANREHLESFPGGLHSTYKSRKKFLLKAQEIATKRDPNFIIVGMKSKWFELNPHHGKMNYDILPDNFKKGVTDFTAIPIMRKIRENKEVPQLLKWTELGHKDIALPERIRTNEGEINNLMEGLCNCNTSDLNYEMTGKDWLVGGLWNGYKGNKPNGFLSNLDYIFPVKATGEYVKDEEGNYMYAYLPKKDWNLLNDEGQSFIFIPDDASEMNNPSVEYSEAKGFLVPKRKGNIEDKWI